MDPIRWEARPALERPTLICAFKGWNDAAEAATTALAFLASKSGAVRFATIDPDEFFDFQVTRPTVRLIGGRTRDVTWPEHVFAAGRPPGSNRDFAYLTGAEPNLRWKAFTSAVAGMARELGVQMVLSLGSLLADVPHTRPVSITGIAGDPEMVERLGFSETRYEGPTGIVGVLHDACAQEGIAAASLWAPVPHYVAAVPSPKAALALVRQVEALQQITVDVTDLDAATTEYERKLDAAVAAEPDVKLLVERLEAQADEAGIAFGDIPSGDSIADEVERFLREQDE